MSRSHKTAKIPAGLYCYTITSIVQDSAEGFPVLKTAVCPFWRLRHDHNGETYGHCRFLKRGDRSRHNPTSLLFDQCKECNVGSDNT